MDDMREFMMATTEFAPATHYTHGEQRTEINVKAQGALNISLVRRLTQVSNATEWEQAKDEWRVTGQVWYIPLRNQPYRLPAVHRDNHPQECICGHPIAWHFEIENTINGNLEILGSEHITNWMIIRHLKEIMGIPESAITEEKIQEWIKAAVKTMKHDWWWSEYGEDWEEMFDHVKELDLRVNVRTKGKYYDGNTRRYEPHYVIAKVKKGSLGKMASVVWRWNHPDNPRKQIETRGYPNEQLWRDVQLLFAKYNKMLTQANEREEEYTKRVEVVKESLKKSKEIADKRKEEIKEAANQIREETRNEYEDTALIEACGYYDIPAFTIDMGKNDWESKFLNDMRNRMIQHRELSERQLNALLKIIDPDSAGEDLATRKQINFIKRLGGDPPENLSKKDASAMIDTLIKNKEEE
tara:strand:+ start:6993 stop:8228 length:1236 start_codon:yes stop_codon:yes gene_type:complete